MKSNSRIRFNPVTKEIEVAGTEKFVKTYFGKLQAMISGAAGKKVAIKKEPKTAKAALALAEKKKPKAVKAGPQKKARKVEEMKPSGKRITHLDSVIGFIQENPEGISTAELKKRTGLVERQIWSIVNRASKAGKIRKVKRGVYGAVAASRG